MAFVSIHDCRRIPGYNSWYRMIQRCHNPEDKNYETYGARGLTVHPRWRDPRNFFEDMGARPAPGYSIDRLDNSLGYEPGNCRWASSTTQRLNQSNVVFLEHNGEYLCLKDWARKLGLPYSTFRDYLRYGCTLDDLIAHYEPRLAT